MRPLHAQVEGPFELPEKFRTHRFPQTHVADCSLPLGVEKQNPRPGRIYRIGGLTVQVGRQLRVEGKDAGGAPWALDIEIKSGGCWLWRADLDRNGKEDLIIVTSDATSAGDSIATVIMIDDRNRPVPWQAPGHYDGEDSGLSNLVDLDGDGRAELLFLYVEGIDRGQARATSITRYEIRDAHVRRLDGRFAGEMFPIVEPKNAKLHSQPDLTNSVDTKNPGGQIDSLIPGTKENCGVPVPITRSRKGALKVDATAAEALSQACYDKITLSDGKRLRLPEMVVLDRSKGREVAFLDVARLLVEIKTRRLAVWLAGRICEDDCHPFLLWASEPPR
jgi:hypothetical protein